MPTAKGAFTAELIALIGPDATRTLIDHYGGSPLYIPRCHLDHPITNVLGEASARLLCERFGGLRVIVPLGHQLALERRNEAIRNDREAGLSIPALARRHGISIRRVYDILGQAHAPLHSEQSATPQRQLSLF